jgi:outer membrane protein OmpA-like peptidoglycan-associated protein
VKHASLLTLLVLAACTKMGPLVDYHDEIDGGIQQAMVDEWAETCAPRELAMAQSHFTFAQLEFRQGDDRRAEEHLLIARKNIIAALEAAEACRPHDRDGDGILDGQDACPDAAETFNGFQDDDGCPEGDRDGDRVFDADDQCPDIPEDLDSFLDTDGCPDPDNDSDGILDGQDACPEEAEDFDGVEDTDGCPDAALDSDGDGIFDDFDRCVSEPETVNEYMDEDGCPDEAPAFVRITEDKIEIDQKIQFTSGKSRILSVSFPILDSVAQVMKDYPDVTIQIEGHTDSDGSEGYNLRLSQSRADAVRAYLTEQGITAARLESVGYGETRPIDTNRTTAGKANNRRVEFRILK